MTNASLKCKAGVHDDNGINVRIYPHVMTKYLANGEPRVYEYTREWCLDCHYERRFKGKSRKIEIKHRSK